MSGIMAENDELRAIARVYRDALDHALAIGKKGLLPDADHLDLLARVREVLTQARSRVDELNGAEHRKGFEIADEEILALAESAGGMHYLTGEGQLKWIAATKRKNAQLRIA